MVMKIAKSKQMDKEYIKEVAFLRAVTRGKHSVIAERAGVSRGAVQAVFSLKFMNKDVIREARRIARRFTVV
jgi:hypothetical protein